MTPWLAIILTLATADNAAMQRLDQNQDGRISLEEFYPTGPAPLHPRMKQVFESFDKDQRGSLTYDDTAKVIASVSGNLPKLTPDVDGNLGGTVDLEVHPKTKRAFVTAQVNGVTGIFLLDTGTTDTILSPEFATQAKVDLVEICIPITAGNYGKIGDFVSLVRVPDLAIEGAHFRNFHAVLQTPKSGTSEFGSSIDGVLGANVIFAKPVTIDLRSRLLTIAPKKLPRADFTLPLRKGEKTATMDADVDGVRIPLLLDTGAAITDAILINQSYHAALRKLAKDDQARIYYASKVRVAGKLIDTDMMCLLREFERSVYGSHFFERHIITVDTAAHKVMLKRHPVEARQP